MRLIRGLHNLHAAHRGGLATIGNFDGVHRGHQAVIAAARALIMNREQPLTVVTFEPTPAEHFSGAGAPPRLTRFAEKVRALSCTRAEQLLCLRFDQQFSELSPEAFVQRVLVNGLGVRQVVVGDDFRFGYRAAGDFALLREFGEQFGFSVTRMPTFALDGERVSSSAIRSALQEGNLQRARVLLGRPYAMCGRVVQGQQLGRELGYPTANIEPCRHRSALRGIFAVRARLADGSLLGGVASLGTRPTVAGEHELLEVHLFDFAGDLYGTKLEVRFLAKLREEAHFASLDALVTQMKEDEREARRAIARMA